MGIFSGLFRSRDKPQNRTAGSAYSFFFGGSTAGKRVNERSAMQMTAVYSCVRILAEAVAGLPLHLYRYKEDGGKEKALDHPLYLLLHDEPNPEMTSFVFRETLMTHLLLWGNAYAQVIRNGKGMANKDMAKLTDRSVVSVDYRLAPEYRFPAAPEDCYAVAREIFLDLSLFGMRADQITLIGDSAGANLAAAVSLMARDRGEFLPRSQILIYPATAADHTENSPFPSVRENGTDYLLTSKRICEYMELYQSGPEDCENPYFAPLAAEDFSNQPQTLILTAEYDPLRDEGEAYGEALKRAGVPVEMHRIPDALHGFFSLPPRFAQVQKAYGYINRFLDEVSHPACQDNP